LRKGVKMIFKIGVKILGVYFAKTDLQKAEVIITVDCLIDWLFDEVIPSLADYEG
jgi:hypothetical protein